MRNSRSLMVAALLGALLALASLGTTLAHHGAPTTGPWCVAEDATGEELFVSGSGHDYCE